MEFKECAEHKERVKQCYGDWFHKLWSGSLERARCEQETEDYRQCVQVGRAWCCELVVRRTMGPAVANGLGTTRNWGRT